MKKSRRRSHRKSVSRPRTQSKGRKTGSHRRSGRKSTRRRGRRTSGRKSTRRRLGRRTSGRRTSGRRTSGRKSTRRKSGTKRSRKSATKRSRKSRARRGSKKRYYNFHHHDDDVLVEVFDGIQNEYRHELDRWKNIISNGEDDPEEERMKNTKNFANKVQNVFDNDGTLNYDNLERDQKINIIKMFHNDYDTEEPPIISKIYIENLLQAYNDAKSGNLQSLKTLVNEKNLNIGFIYGEQQYNLHT